MQYGALSNLSTISNKAEARYTTYIQALLLYFYLAQCKCMTACGIELRDILRVFYENKEQIIFGQALIARNFSGMVLFFF